MELALSKPARTDSFEPQRKRHCLGTAPRSRHPIGSTLQHQQPNKLSSEDVRVQDIQKEIIDLILHRIDSFNSDCDLLSWLDQQVLSQTRPSHPHHKSKSSPLSDNNTNNPRNQLGESFLHPLASQLELDMDFEQDPEKMLEQPLCFTPLFSPILLHVMEAFSDGYKNPHLALYLFDWVRSHSDPLVKYFGLTRDVYLLVLRIKWEAFQDFGGIHKHLLEMKALGLELDERFKRLIHHITRLVLQDEIQAERRLALRQPLPPHQSPENILDTLRKITPLERYHISQIESLLNQFIQNQDDLLATKLRSPPPAPPHHT
ncbi:uncharacterized protein VP01_2199g2 [Puccinia sorghi]|uniref:Mtf2-like C-terminal domain-containing protein n=1 Tax=Puccinia sorghi TaxID=27349 RepID=A0A0L6V8X7_9BASI|nr:uncharacterized protein VP01_2199g2 [Puccinia sorghi]